MDLNIPKEKVNTTSAGTSNVSAVSTSAKMIIIRFLQVRNQKKNC